MRGVTLTIGNTTRIENIPIHAYPFLGNQPDEVVKLTMGTGRQSNGFLLTPIENRLELKGEEI